MGVKNEPFFVTFHILTKKTHKLKYNKNIRKYSRIHKSAIKKDTRKESIRK